MSGMLHILKGKYLSDVKISDAIHSFCHRYGMLMLATRSGGHHSGEGVTYEGLTLYPPSKWHTYAGEGMAGFMW